MSGAEATAVLGVISSIITIIDTAKNVYDAATSKTGLPEAFRECAGKLPLVKNILESIEKGGVDEEGWKEVKGVVEGCKEKANKLQELFQKVVPADGAQRLERYYKAVKAVGKGNEVESLMKGILEDMALLVNERGMKASTKAQQDQIAKAISELQDFPKSVPDYVFQETGSTVNYSGSGAQYNAWGENIAQGQGRIWNSAGGTMNFEGPREKEVSACLTALFLTDPRDDRQKLIETKGSRVDGTCEWIKTNLLYVTWLQSESQLLWLSGGPGKGKTMLAIFLAEDFEQIVRRSPNDLVLQYFCDNKDDKRNTATAIIRGLIFQLLDERPKLYDHILPSFKIQKESLFARTSFETLWRIFETMIRDPILGNTYCVLDALDECDEVSSEVLLRRFRGLFSSKLSGSSAGHLKLIVINRDLPDFIPDILSTFPRLRLDPDVDIAINSDINRFIDVKVDELSTYKRFPKSLTAHVKQVFRDRAQGTFLWVGIVAKDLRNYKVTEIEKTLDRLPVGLEELYSRMLLQIDYGRRKTAARILRWVVLAVRPLTLSELSVVIEPTHSTTKLSPEEVIIDQVSYYGYFLTVKGQEVNLIHQPAKDYLLRGTFDPNPELESFRVIKETGNLEIARTCLNYLQNGALNDGVVDLQDHINHLKTFPLLSYAALHWPEHARSLPRSADIFDLKLPLYDKTFPIRQYWLETCFSINYEA